MATRGRVDARHAAVSGERVAAVSGERYLDLPRLGAVPDGSGSVEFRLWAPHAERLGLRVEGRGGAASLEPEGCGYHRARFDDLRPAARYRYMFPDGAARADPASRYQPEGVHGPSALFDPAGHRWSDGDFRVLPWARWVIYEMHVGTFTDGGTFDDAAEVLDHIVELGANAVEPMPVAEFPGRRNWGYDGVFPFAVQSSYGGPAALQRFVDACHQHGLAVVLDVVYNHLGPEGNVLPCYGPYTSDRYRTPWGDAINFDGPESDEVRRFFVANALQWFDDFHVDALRLDAVHGIVDTTARPFLLELAEATEALSRRLDRPLHLIAESADNDPRLVSSRSDNGLGMDAQWNDDFHHALHAVLSGERTGYYCDFGSLQQLARAAAEGFVFQGQRSAFRRRHHGAPSAQIAPARFVVYGENHDQVGNRPGGDRPAATAGPDRLCLSAAFALLSAGVPLLFMGEEYAETAPFPYFVDHGDPVLLDSVRLGRAAEMRALGFEEPVLDPADPATFVLARPDRSLREKGEHARVWATYRRLLALRATHPALQAARGAGVTADVLGGEAVRVLRSGAGGTLLLAAIYNFGRGPAPVSLPGEEVTAGNGAGRWRKLLDSTDPALGGNGAALPDEAGAGDRVVLAAAGFCVYELAEPSAER